MSYGIRVGELRGTVDDGRPPQGQWLSFYDPDAHEGRGEAAGTWDAGEALAFEGIAAAMACWRQQSRARPLRADGKPNKPLTAFSVCIERLPET